SSCSNRAGFERCLFRATGVVEITTLHPVTPHPVRSVVAHAIGLVRTSHATGVIPSGYSGARTGAGAGNAGRVRSRSGTGTLARRLGGGSYRSYQPWRKARPRVQPHAWNISQAGVASLSISILSASRASAAKM